MSRAHALLAALLLSACGSTGGDPPGFVSLEDQHGVVGEEMFFEIRASDPELGALTFGFEGSAPTSGSAQLLPAGNGTSALFRWTPAAADVGIWVFDFEVSDGVNKTVETIAVTIDSAAGDAPVFRQPLGAGTTLDLTSADCLNLDIQVDDPDSSAVEITQEVPLIAGATLEEAAGGGMVWQWCPNKDQISSGDSFVLVLAADDGEHQTIKRYLIVLRDRSLSAPVDLGGFVLHQAGATCAFEFPDSFEIESGSTVVIARDASRAAFEEFWGVTMPASTVFISSGDTCPRINGDESFFVADSDGNVIDGPTPIMFEHENFERIDGALPGTELSSWDIFTDTLPTPGFAAHDETADRLFISEFSDAPGTGSFVFEFVELAVD